MQWLDLLLQIQSASDVCEDDSHLWSSVQQPLPLIRPPIKDHPSYKTTPIKGHTSYKSTPIKAHPSYKTTPIKGHPSYQATPIKGHPFKMLLFSIALLPLQIYFVLFYFSLPSCMFNYLKYLESQQRGRGAKVQNWPHIL